MQSDYVAKRQELYAPASLNGGYNKRRKEHWDKMILSPCSTTLEPAFTLAAHGLAETLRDGLDDLAFELSLRSW